MFMFSWLSTARSDLGYFLCFNGNNLNEQEELWKLKYEIVQATNDITVSESTGKYIIEEGKQFCVQEINIFHTCC